MASREYEKFIESMNITFDHWKDGTGYDLEALKAMSVSERKHVEDMLRRKVGEDWRVTEALAALGTPAAVEGIRETFEKFNGMRRLEAAYELHQLGQLKDLTGVLNQALREGERDHSVFCRAIDMVGWYKVTGTIPQLLRMALRAEGGTACHCAAVLYYLHDLSKSAFDWDHRPFFLRFNTTYRAEREAAFRELCAKIKVDPEPIMKRP